MAGLLGSGSYITSPAYEGVSGAAQELVSEYRSKKVADGGPVGLCWIYRSEKDLSDVSISFSFATEVPQSSQVASFFFTAYKMGTLGLANSSLMEFGRTLRFEARRTIAMIIMESVIGGRR
ncbi:hypothetical protein [Streptomyces sp. NPDC020298]|uniref:hypothetical protein n=1 Tax=unclassified Streptomyces TaxID=2593676 RepID=UPI0033F74026